MLYSTCVVLCFRGVCGSIYRAVPQITAKWPPNARNHHHTGKLSRMNYFIAFQYILRDNLRFPMYIFPLYCMTFPIAWLTSVFSGVYGCIFGGQFWNRNSWNDQNNPSISGLSWLQTCQNQLKVSLWRFYSHSDSGMRVFQERTTIILFVWFVWLISTIPNSRIGPQKCALRLMQLNVI